MTHLTSRRLSQPPRFYTCRPILSSLKEPPGSPTFTYSLLLHAMLSDPENASYVCPFPTYAILPSGILKPLAIPTRFFYGAQSLQPSAYGLQHPCLRLTQGVTDLGSRLGTGCVGSTLSRWNFHPRVSRRLVAHQQISNYIST